MSPRRTLPANRVVIECDGMSAEIDLDVGGSVRTLRWKGHDILRPTPPGASDPLELACFPLAPFSNRIGGAFTFSGRKFDLPANMVGVCHPIHGFAWQHRWNLEHCDISTAQISMVDLEPMWPQPYSVRQLFTISGQSLRIEIELTNLGDGPMPGGIGLHPYFRRGSSVCSIQPGAMWEKDGEGLPALPTGNHPFVNSPTAMADVRLDHSFSGWDGIANIVYPNDTLRMKLTASESLRELVIYSPDHDYFCIEPVSHLTNASLRSESDLSIGWSTIEAGECLNGVMEIEVERIDPM